MIEEIFFADELGFAPDDLFRREDRFVVATELADSVPLPGKEGLWAVLSIRAADFDRALAPGEAMPRYRLMIQATPAAVEI